MMLIFALRFLVIGKLATKRLNKDNPKVSLYVCVCVHVRVRMHGRVHKIKGRICNPTLFCVDNLAQPFQFLLRTA